MQKKVRELEIQRIKTLEKEIERLKQENKDLKVLVQSKRFRASWKLAAAFNNIFPHNSSRRKLALRIGKHGIKVYNKISSQKVKKYHKQIRALAGNKPIIIYDSIPWDVDLKQRPQHLALQLSMQNCFVVYYERTGKKLFYKVNENLVTTRSMSVISGIKKLKQKKFFFVSSTNAYRSVYEEVKNTLGDNVYLIYEFIDEIDDKISPMAHELQAFYDNLKHFKPFLLTASAKKLAKKLEDDGLPKSRIILSQNAVNIEDFDYTKKIPKMPSDLLKISKLNKPIIGYYGALAPWLDGKLMNSVSKKRKDLEFVYIGPDYNDGKKNFKKYPNVHFLGAKEYRQLPDYALHFDCAIIPFGLGEIAKSTSPVKLFEYMAMGLPTVCTRDLDECKGYKNVFISKNAAEFERYLDKAIKEKTIDSSRQILLSSAKQNTWEQRAKDMVNYINNKKGIK